MYYKLAAEAANWWSKEILNRYRKFHGGQADTSFTEKLALFEQILAKEIHQHLKFYHYISLGCYYYPDTTLIKAANNSDLDKCYFPVQAHLDIVNNSISVSLNFDEPHELHINL